MICRYVWSVIPALVVAPAASAGPETGSIVLLTALLLTFCIGVHSLLLACAEPTCSMPWNGSIYWIGLSNNTIHATAHLAREEARGTTRFINAN